MCCSIHHQTGNMGADGCMLALQVKRAVGTLLIEENKSLFEEASALTDILGDVQMSTGALVARQQLCNNPQRRLVRREGGTSVH